ncbi:MAG: glycoside hydrolase family 2 protein, partial [Prolixibacteraceae bacterium]|nr:glycoside hydrolase family 2 protein [Prolixibacteraceae bacterium]
MRLAVIIALISTVTFLISCNPDDHNTTTIIELNEGWRFRQVGETQWMDAVVPGTVHTDLMANGIIEDPFFRLNERDVQWIDKVNWEYETTFQVDKSLLVHDRIIFDFKGLDTYANIFLNGRHIMETNNMFREWVADIKPFLKEGKNELRIEFLSPINEGIKKYDAQGFEIPVSDNDLAEIGQVAGKKKVSIYMRKAGYHFGWDWGPRIVTSGIWRPAYIKAWDNAKIEDVQIIQNEVSADKAKLTAVFEIDAHIKNSGAISIESEGVKLADKKIELEQGMNLISVDFEINNPRLWWTNGLGEPNMYDITTKLNIGALSVSRNHRIGIRKLEFVREKDADGTSFLFKLNDVSVFMKGVNYIPNDMFLPRVTDENYRNVVNTTKISNMNMIRVWGGGVYENDIFYNLCDEAGILVWQDFMFSCAMFPGDKAFLDNVRQEAIDNVKRLRNHPCIALWCGNNENLIAWYNWGWKHAEEQKNPQNAALIWKYYEDLFHKLLPEVVEKYDPQRGYVASSPSSGTGIVPDLVNGDEHYWGVWWGKESFETYATYIPRFMSEYGFQSFPDIRTVRKYAFPEDYNINSEVMKSHQRSSIGNETIEYYMLKEYRRPKDFESFLYVNHVLQAEGIKFGLEGHRRATPFCMGSLYWQLNDVWPVASWSSTDYYQRWKALQYYVKKGFEPILISPYILENDLRVAIINDKLEDINGEMILTLVDFEGKELKKHRETVTAKANASVALFSEPVNRFIGSLQKSNVFLIAEFKVNNQAVSENSLFFRPFKELQLPRPDVQVKTLAAKGGFEISLFSDKLAKNVYLEIGDEDGFFSDNYFDL